MTLPETLTAIAKWIEGDQWEEPDGAADACWLAAEAINQFVPRPMDMSEGETTERAALARKVWGEGQNRGS